MLSAESQHLLHRFQSLPLREKKIVFMLVGEIIAESDSSLDLNAPDEEGDVKFCKAEAEDDEQPVAENLDLELFDRLGNIVGNVRDSSSTTNKLLQVCENQEQAIKKLTIANSNTRALISSYPTPASTSSASANMSTTLSTPITSASVSFSTKWMNFSRNSILTSTSTSSTPRKPENANKSNNGIEFVSSSYFTSASKGTTSAPITATAYANDRYKPGNISTNTPQTQAPAQIPTAKPPPQPQQGPGPKLYAPLTQSPYTLPSLEFFLAKQSRSAPKRRGKSGTFADLCNKSKNEMITSYLTSEFKAPPKPKFVKPNPTEVEEFNDMFVVEAKPEEAEAGPGPTSGAGA